MIRLFDEIPYIQSGRLTLRLLEKKDVPDLKEMTQDPEVYRYLPTYLYELKYDDKNTVIERMEEECIRNKDSFLLAVVTNEDPEHMAGIAEIYSYRPEREKASIGYRLRREYWGRGIGTETARLLKKYLLEKTDVRKITAHACVENKASARILQKNGFIPKWRNLVEDWGQPELITVDKYRFKLSREEKEEILHSV